MLRRVAVPRPWLAPFIFAVLVCSVTALAPVRIGSRRRAWPSGRAMAASAVSSAFDEADECATTLNEAEDTELGSPFARSSPFDRPIATLAFPALGGMLVDPFLSLADGAFIGRLGSSNLAALGPCSTIFAFASTISWALREATCVLVGDSLARGDTAQASSLVRTTLGLGLVLGACMMATLRLGGSAVLSLLGVTPCSPLYSLAQSYLMPRALAAPAVIVTAVMEGAMRGAKVGRASY